LEAPAIPLSRGDEEFVTGRLTQAEILEKYTLNEQAIEQVEEVTARFPGHVEAQERRVALLRVDSETDRLAEALVGMAVALRASGNLEGARLAAAEADHLGPLGADTRERLERISLLEPAKAAESVETLAAVDVEPEATEPEAILLTEEVASAPQVEARPEPPSPPTTVASSDVVIDFDAMDDTDEPAEEPAQAPAVAAASDGSKQAGQEMLDEVTFYLEQGMLAEARQRLEALQKLGYGGDELERLEARAAELVLAEPVADAEPAEPAADDPAESPSTEEATEIVSEVAFVDDDLSAIAAALEQELLDEDSGPLVPDAGSEQSLDEVFAAFKDHVDREVGADDHRTHYDLGIGYKEMGLIQEAIGEFEIALQAPELAREAGIMLAHCHRESGRPDEAAAIYRRAIESADGDADAVLALRYELAEVLVESGDAAAALDELRDVLRSNPEYRDVQNRIAELEARSTA
jgi:tetratricopeptide (TPR) repeat protein